MTSIEDGPLYADGPTATVDVEVDASPAVVWALITDIDLPARFSAEFRGAAWQDAEGPALGARFVGRNAHDAVGAWETTSTVVEFEPERCFGYAVSDPGRPSASWRFSLEELPGGRTRLTQWMQIGPGPSGLTPAIEQWPDKERRIIGRRLREHRESMQRTCEGIKQLAEAREAD